MEIGKSPEGPFVEQKLKFKRRIDIGKINDYDGYQYDCKDDEYWVMGDNYAASSDCFSKRLPIYKDNIVGVLIAIEGQCKISQKHVSEDDGTHISATCTNRKRYAWPKYF